MSPKKHAKKKPKMVYYVLVDHVPVFLDIDTCTMIGNYIIKYGSSNSAVMAFAHQLLKLKETPQEANIKPKKKQDMLAELLDELEIVAKQRAFETTAQQMAKDAFLKIGEIDDAVPILLDEDFCLFLGNFIKQNGGGNKVIKAIGRRFLQVKDWNLKRTIKQVKTRKKKGESLASIAKDLGISAATASKYNKL